MRAARVHEETRALRAQAVPAVGGPSRIIVNRERLVHDLCHLRTLEVERECSARTDANAVV